MSKYTFKKVPSESLTLHQTDFTEVVITTEHDSLYDLLEEFKCFLSACGYSIDPSAELKLVGGGDCEDMESGVECCDGSELRDSIQAEGNYATRPPNCS